MHGMVRAPSGNVEALGGGGCDDKDPCTPWSLGDNDTAPQPDECTRFSAAPAAPTAATTVRLAAAVAVMAAVVATPAVAAIVELLSRRRGSRGLTVTGALHVA